MDDNMILEQEPQGIRLQCGVTDSIGNIVGVCIEYFKSIFPANFFASEYVNTQYVIKDFRRVNNSLADLKKPKPILVTNVKYDLNAEPNFLGMSEHYKNNVYPMYSAYRNPNLNILYHDHEKRIRVSYGMREMRIMLEFILIFETQIQQINSQAFIAQAERHNERPFFLDRYIEPKIPYIILHQIARHNQIDISNNNHSELLEYMNKFSRRPISYRIQTSTSNKEFFFKGKNNLLVNFDGNPEPDEGTKKDMADGIYTLRDTLAVRFSIPTMYIYESYLRPMDLRRYVTMDIRDMLLNNESFIPAYTLQFVQTPQVDRDDLVLIAETKFYIDEEREKDAIDLRSILNPVTVDFIHHNIRHNIDNTTMFNFYLRRQEDEVSYEKDYSVDYVNLALVLINPVQYSTYSMSAYVNRNALNEFMQNQENPEGSFDY